MARLSEVLDSTTFKRTACVSTSCGVKQVAGGCAPTPAPTPAALASDAALKTHFSGHFIAPGAIAAALLLLLL